MIENLILVCDYDETNYYEAKEKLADEGLIFEFTSGIRDFHTKMLTHHYGLFILKQDLAGGHFFGLLSDIRTYTETPILLLVNDDNHLIDSIRPGFDDFIKSQFTPNELCIRIYGTLNRRYKNRNSEDIISAGDLIINTRTRKVFVNNKEIELTSKEFDMLVLLISHKGQVFTRKQLYMQIWGNDYDYDDNNAMVFVHKLRKKIEPDPDEPRYILTQWGVGYRFSNIV